MPKVDKCIKLIRHFFKDRLKIHFSTKKIKVLKEFEQKGNA
jgi:hypothetical protein